MKQAIALALAIAFIASALPAAASSMPEFTGVPDRTVEMNSGPLDKFFDLRNYVRDDATSPANMSYEIVNQTNNALVDCFLADNFYISCNMPEQDGTGLNSITVRATNGKGLSGEDTFGVLVEQTSRPSGRLRISLDKSDIQIENGQTGYAKATVVNGTNYRQCFKIKADLGNTIREELSVTVPSGSVCLDEKESLDFTVGINAGNDARAQNYDFDIIADYGSATSRATLRAEVLDTYGKINLERISDYYVCKNPYTQDIRLRLENNTGSRQTLNLSPENQILMPEFEFAKTRLDARSSIELSLKIHTNNNTPQGEQAIDITAESGNLNVRRQIKINLTDCDSDVFNLEVSPTQTEIRRGQEKTITVTLFNKSNHDRQISISSDSDLPNNLNATTVTLAANEHKKLKLLISARVQDKSGTHIVTVNAWNGKENESKKINVSVLPEHSVDVRAAQNDYGLRSASATKPQSYQVMITNRSDYKETLKLDVDNSDSTIKTEISKSNVTINPGFDETITLTVTPTGQTGLGRHTVQLLVHNGQIDEKLDIKFTVIEPEKTQNNQALELLSYPQSLEITRGEEKEIAIVVRNNLGEELKNAAVNLKTSEEKIIMASVAIDSLKPNETKTITAKLSAFNGQPAGTYTAAFEIAGKETFNFTKFTIKVLDANTVQQPASGNALSGLFVLGGSATTILALLIIAVILLIALSIYNSIYKEEAQTGQQ